jgi:hypothetical protein
MAQTDYQTAFDSVSHSWIIKSFMLIGINNKIIPFTKKNRSYCKTGMYLYIHKGA